MTSRILLLAGFFLLGAWIAAESAEAHTKSRADCIRQAVSRSDTHDEFKRAFRACRKKAVKHSVWHSCRPGRRPLIHRKITVKHAKASSGQRRNITEALRVGRRMKVPKSHLVAIVAAMTQEASATNPRHGHGTSVGILQLISTHGSVSWRMRVANSAGWFYRGARKIDPRGKMPLATGSRWGLIQSVQRSGHPRAYNRWIPEAKRTVRVFLGPCKES